MYAGRQSPDSVKARSAQAERAVLVGVDWSGRDGPSVSATLEELGLLAESAGAQVVGRLLQTRERPDAATFIGRGKLEQLQSLAADTEANLVVFDDELAPAQQRNIERVLERKTLDRTQLILDIFARRARSREGRLQVERAQLDYLLPRLAGKGVLLSRLGAGIGTRGPGETKLETDRRRIRRRIQSLEREIEHVRRTRGTRRSGRHRAGAPVVALVGYTNAGKSTLFNALTQAGAAASDLLFMTLDPLVRRARLGAGRDVLLVDTVGFIQKLPHQLVAAFRATLEEVAEADLVLHVADASADDRAEREAAVLAVLREIGAADLPSLSVLNKLDRLTPERAAALRGQFPDAALLSARSGEGLDALVQQLVARLDLAPRLVRLRFPADDLNGIASVYGAGRVTAHELDGDEVRLEAELPARLAERYRARFEPDDAGPLDPAGGAPAPLPSLQP
jgi:GTP-binding protein HflX